MNRFSSKIVTNTYYDKLITKLAIRLQYRFYILGVIRIRMGEYF